MKEEFFQEFILAFMCETSHQTKDCNIHEQPPRFDFIESWFQSIVGQEVQSDFGNIWLSFTSVYFGHAFHSLIAVMTSFPILEFIPQFSWMLE
jgi:hypothetical protein